MAGRWTDKTPIDTLSDDDLLLIADMSAPDGSRDRTVLVQRLRAWLQTGQVIWGAITGNLQDQTDLWNAIQNAIQGATLRTPKGATWTGGVYQFAAGDERYLLTVWAGGYSNATTFRVRVPSHATVAFPVGTRLEVVRTDDPSDPDAAVVIIEGAAGVTINGSASLSQWKVTTLVKTAENTWLALRSA